MNDDEIDIGIIATEVDKYAPAGTVMWDDNANTMTISTGNSTAIVPNIYTTAGYNGSSYAFHQPPRPALELKDGAVKFGDFEIPVDHLEIILRQLYEDVKKNNPEHFI